MLRYLIYWHLLNVMYLLGLCISYCCYILDIEVSSLVNVFVNCRVSVSLQIFNVMKKCTLCCYCGFED